jgi:hypothetical protein
MNKVKHSASLSQLQYPHKWSSCGCYINNSKVVFQFTSPGSPLRNINNRRRVWFCICHKHLDIHRKSLAEYDPRLLGGTDFHPVFPPTSTNMVHKPSRKIHHSMRNFILHPSQLLRGPSQPLRGPSQVHKRMSAGKTRIWW